MSAIEQRQRDASWRSLADAFNHLEELIAGDYADGDADGYTTTEQTKQDQRRAAELLREAAELIARCNAREEPRWQPFAELEEAGSGSDVMQ